MKDITFVFSVGLILVLGITSLDLAIEKLTLSAATQAEHNLPGFLSSYKAAQAATSNDERPIVLIFGSSGDTQTELFKDQVLRSSNVHSIKELFIWSYIDINQSVHKETVRQFSVKTTPTICVVDQSGLEVSRLQGFTPAHVLIGQLAKCLPKTGR